MMLGLRSFFLVSFLLLILAPKIFASEILTPHDIIYRKDELSPEKLVQLSWLPHSHSFSYIEKGTSLIVMNIDGEEIRRFDIKDLNSLINSSYKQFPNITWISDSRFWFQHDSKILTYDINADSYAEINKIKEDAENIVVFSPKRVAYTVGPNLYISIDGQISAITDFKPDQNIKNGHIVHRNEFGIDQGSFWSKSGKFLAYYRMDESMVDDYPFLDFRSNPVKINTIKYPMAGRTSHQVKLLIYDIEENTEVTLDTGEPADQYLTGVTWGLDDEHIYVNILNRAQNHLKTMAFDTKTGKQINTLFEHKAKKYINPQYGLYFTEKNPLKPLWCSAHTGFSELFELDIEARALLKRTYQRKDISSCLGFFGAEQKFFYHAFNIDYPEQMGFIYDGVNEISLTKEQGLHNIKPSSDGNYILDIFSNPKTPYRVNLISASGHYIKTIYKAQNPLANYKQVEFRLDTIRSADDKYDLYGRLLLPPNFDEKKQYPAILYVYGGPHVQIVQDRWLLGARLWEVMMAQKGYVVFSLDNRGSKNRGLEFEQETFHALGTAELADQMKGVSYLNNLAFVDKNRLGVYGWSFGGFMATSLMLKHPHVFKVGVAGGAVIDWGNYEVMYTERYMGLPEDNKIGYMNSNLLNFISELQGKFLIISGTHDDTVVPRNTELFIDEAIKQGKQIDSFFYPYGKHHFDIKSEYHLHEKITKYFEDNL